MNAWDIVSYFVFLYPLYMSFVWVIGGLIFYYRWENRSVPRLDVYPKFSIIVPAHNEEEQISATIENLRDLDYPDYEVLVVNDGSSDRTAEIIDALATRHSRWLRIVHVEPNVGKARATNAGILLSRGHFILVMDADSLIEKDVLTHMAAHFLSMPRVGAVTGNPRVLNRTSLLGKIQVGEYSSIIGLIKRTQRILGKVLTVSGVISAFRRSALLECGLYDADTVTEDIDMTWKLQKNFWDVRYEPRALCWVLVPETVRGLYCQRVRWAQGGVEVLKKHAGIWRDPRQRRLWPVYVEYVAGVAWAYSFALYIAFWLLSWLLAATLQIELGQITPSRFPLLPHTTGSILALVCLIQFLVSISIDMRYERRSSLKYYFWAVWYPFLYWVISAVAIIVGFFNVFIRRKGVTVTWQSPDRGLHSIRS